MTTPIEIAVEGVIGVGKTTLAQALARHLGAVGLWEDALSNPFLADFYREPERWGLACQLHFLVARLAQFARPRPGGLPVVADHTFDKEALFAAVNLAGDELALYQRFHARLAGDLGFRPRVTVYLVASRNEVLARIRRRGRPEEAPIGVDYLDRLVTAYERHFRDPGSRRVVVVAAAGDLVAADGGAVRRLLEACLEAPPGLSFCNPG